MQFAAICHYDTEDLTYDNVVIPQFVPVVLDFDPDNAIGQARLTWIEPTEWTNGAVKCEVELDTTIHGLPDPPNVIAGVVDATRHFDSKTLTAYLTGGYIANISVLTTGAEGLVFGELDWNDEEEFGSD